MFINNRDPLDKLMEDLRKHLKELSTELSTDKDLLSKAANHADQLKKLAQQLKSTHQETAQFAATALDASKR